MNDTEFIDYYELLELSPKANTETVERVFRYLAKKHHPDVSPDSNVDHFRKLIKAYETLRNPESRASYDVTYERQQQLNGELVEGANAASSDCAERYSLLSVLYAQRRRDGKKPGIGIGTLETLVPFPPEVLNFHLWYFREKGWVAREESGQISITAAGVDKIDSMNEPSVANNQLRLGHVPSRLPQAQMQDA